MNDGVGEQMTFRQLEAKWTGGVEALSGKFRGWRISAGS